jgi:beta-N-acetylhexosaminidase
MSQPLAAIFGLAGPDISDTEASFFRDAQPFGFILFQRNCDNPDQIRRLTGRLRDITGRNNLPILIDQEGGRVQRLKPPHWRQAPPAALFGRLAKSDPGAADQAVRLNAQLIAMELSALGINVDCLPCLDVHDPAGHDVIGDRAFSNHPLTVARLGRAQVAGLAAGGIVPVMKHIPGHGRAGADSHRELPVVDATRNSLIARDFAPFGMLADLPMAMTAHVVYSAVDPERPATLSPLVIGGVIRELLGFDGILMTDDLSMQALTGTIAERGEMALAAGCDIALHCNGEMAEMTGLASGLPTVSGTKMNVWTAAEAQAMAGRIDAKPEDLLNELDDLLQAAPSS